MWWQKSGCKWLANSNQRPDRFGFMNTITDVFGLKLQAVGICVNILVHQKHDLPFVQPKKTKQGTKLHKDALSCQMNLFLAVEKHLKQGFSLKRIWSALSNEVKWWKVMVIISDTFGWLGDRLDPNGQHPVMFYVSTNSAFYKWKSTFGTACISAQQTHNV